MRALVAGIDIGAGTTKCAILDEQFKPIGTSTVKTTPHFEQTAQDAFKTALDQGNIKRDQIQYIATTGLGRYSVSFRHIQITDITCTAKAVHQEFPETSFVLDIGAQSTRAINKDNRGKVKDFRMNEKCAAGSGGFLERTSKYLGLDIKNIGEISASAKNSEPISSVCAVLAESEIINHISDGKAIEDIIRGVHNSLAERCLMLLKRVGLNGSVVLVGGVAFQKGMELACVEKLGVKVLIPLNPQLVAATGAAILGWQRLKKVIQIK